MVEAITNELKIRKTYLKDEPIDSIYFGGGTPSILDMEDLNLLYDTAIQHFHFNRQPEITLEANPDDLSSEKLKGLYKLGINRLSIGIQSFDDQVLKYLNRAHSSSEAVNCIKNARNIGFDNLSIDLIFSIPTASNKILEEDIQKALSLNPEHISVYSLTIEEKTVFGNWQKKGKLIPLNDENSASQFDLLITQLERNGYEQYEISNFCRDQKYAHHNTSYWKNVPYLGVGPGSHSFNGESRQFNISHNHHYLKSLKNSIVPFEVEHLNQKDRINEFLLTSLRTKWGCQLKKLHELFDYDLMKEQETEVKNLVRDELIQIKNETLFLTRKGKFLADEIILRLFQE